VTTEAPAQNWHLVEAQWWCNCRDVQRCETEKYISDIRILKAELDKLKAKED